MATRLHVANLPYSATEEELKELFGQAGTVTSISLPTDRTTGRPRGFGFVEMENASEAEEALRRFDGYSLEGRSLRVEMAREREERAPGSGYGGGERQGGYGGRGRDRGYQGGRGRAA